MALQTYYSHGKLLLTGEYVVLDGAEALAVPTRFGQNLVVKEGKTKDLKWNSFDADERIWFTDCITIEEVKNKLLSDQNSLVKNTLIEILFQANIQNPKVFETGGYEIETHLTFPRNWGLGTSSTLINNIAQWFQIDAFELLRNSFGGSGYDIACAQTNRPIVFKLIEEQPKFEEVSFNPSFKEHIYFVYLNRKQSSKSAIASYLDKQGNIGPAIKKINAITEQIIDAKEPKEFALALQKHEIEMSNILQQETVQETYFDDFRGVIKSLGAWGGDFVLAIAKENPTGYFKERGYSVVIPYNEMIL